jgi:hypothetical protein
MKYKINGLNTAALVCIMLFASGTANAKDVFDGSSNLICAAINVVACMDGTNCTKGEARTFDLPEFMTIDFKKKIIHVTYDGGANEAESPIKNIEISGTQLVLQGIENNHGWTMAIHRDNGRMSLSAVGDELSYSMFGACKAL